MIRPLTAAGMALSLTCAGAALAQAPAPAAPRPPPAAGPSLALAIEAAQTAVSTCSANGYKVAVSVIDSAGVLKVVTAGDGVPAMGVTSSTRKALTSLKYKEPTAVTQDKVTKDTALAATIAADATLFPRAGAQPILSKGEVIGAIGVGGAPGGDKDDVCALAGVAKIKDRL